MPQAIDPVFVHQAVAEGDIPPRRPPSETMTAEALMPIQPLPPGPWSFPSRSSPVRGAPPRVKVERDLTPIVTVIFLVWIGLCFVYEISG